MNYVLNTVIAMNNKGVRMMSGGDYTSASIAFATALNQFKSIMESAENRFSLTPESSRWPRIHSSVQVPFEDQNTNFAIFTECLALSPIISEAPSSSSSSSSPPPPTPSSCVRNFDFFTAVILYNAGLAFHLRAKNVPSAKDMRRACHCYKLAMKLCRMSLPYTNTECMVFLLALTNNLAALAMESYEYECFEMQRQRMSEIMVEIEFPPEFFCSNYVATMDALNHPAPAA